MTHFKVHHHDMKAAMLFRMIQLTYSYLVLLESIVNKCLIWKMLIETK